MLYNQSILSPPNSLKSEAEIRSETVLLVEGQKDHRQAFAESLMYPAQVHQLIYNNLFNNTWRRAGKKIILFFASHSVQTYL